MRQEERRSDTERPSFLAEIIDDARIFCRGGIEGLTHFIKSRIGLILITVGIANCLRAPDKERIAEQEAQALSQALEREGVNHRVIRDATRILHACGDPRGPDRGDQVEIEGTHYNNRGAEWDYDKGRIVYTLTRQVSTGCLELTKIDGDPATPIQGELIGDNCE